MTSGEFTSYPLDKIWVNRDQRQRKVLKNVDELAASIKSVGLIEPLVIKRDGELKVGERRFEATKLLGWTHVSVQFTDEVDPAQLHLLELEENLQRVNLEWPEECLAVDEYHRLRQSINPDWTAGQTSEVLGRSEATTSRQLMVAKELIAGNTKVVTAPKFSVAAGIITRSNERKATSALLAATGKKADERTVPLLNVDFNEWSQTYSGPLFNFLHCDFPYGVAPGNLQLGTSLHDLGTYNDEANVYEILLDTLEARIKQGNLLAPSCHLLFWYSMERHCYTVDRLTAMGWKVIPFPIIWHKSDNIGFLHDPSREPRRIYETALMASLGDRKIVRATSNLFPFPARDRPLHISEKPVEMLKYFFQMFVDQYSIVLDPTAGSANALKAAQALGAHEVLGLERNTEFFNRSKEAYYGE